MTGLEFETAVRRYLSESTAAYWTPADIAYMGNTAQNQLCYDLKRELLGTLYTTATDATPNGVLTAFSLPASCLYVVSVRREGELTEHIKARGAAETVEVDGGFDQWEIRDNAITFFYPPANTDTLYIAYVKIPTQLTGGAEVLDFPDRVIDALVLLTVSLAFRKGGRYLNKSREYERLYREAVSRLNGGEVH